MRKEEIAVMAQEIKGILEAHGIQPRGFTVSINVTTEQFKELQTDFDGKTAEYIDFIMAEAEDNWAISFTQPLPGIQT
ncbi:MAG: hypothetical protein CL607_19670 [Anaerolineaceae bacterium]|nr:hypothetical protein [Anaerolineaceae bacterium]